MSRTETTWLSWPEIQRGAADFFTKGAQSREQFGASRDDLLNGSLQGFFPGIVEALDLAASGAGPADPGADQPGLAFKVRPLPARQVGEAIRLLQQDTPAAVEFLVRHGCRGHRGLRDAQGAEVGYRFEPMADGRVRLDALTFECYALTGVAWILATAILQGSCSALTRKDSPHG